jgi:NAD-dependent deacetylase
VLDEIVKAIRRCRSCVVLTGAGISAESGVPTFRGKEGLWGKFRAEELATMSAFVANPKIVWEWYNWRRRLIGEVQPNPGHYALRDLQQMFESFTLVTQNIDGLHRAAGSDNILELHGNIYRNKCVNCNEPVGEDINIDPDAVPCCPRCGGKIRPDVVWFGEMLDPRTINTAFAESERTELFLSVGTSALVQPAASLPLTARHHGATLVEINPDKTPITHIADYYVSARSGEFLPRLVERLRESSAPA